MTDPVINLFEQGSGRLITGGQQGVLMLFLKQDSGEAAAAHLTRLLEVGKSFLPGFFFLPASAEGVDIQRAAGGCDIGKFAYLGDVPVLDVKGLLQGGKIAECLASGHFFDGDNGPAGRLGIIVEAGLGKEAMIEGLSGLFADSLPVVAEVIFEFIVKTFVIANAQSAEDNP